MEVVILKTPDEVAKYGADLCAAQIQKKPNSVLGLATGSTPEALYTELARRHSAGELSFRQVTTFNLDEYVGLNSHHPQSYHHYMREKFFSKVDIEPENTFIPNGDSPHPLKEGAIYEEQIRNKGGIDFQILGIGRNGHIGFNEPTSSLSSRTRVKTLAESTVADNSRFFQATEFQPRLGITMGIGTILEAKQIVLLATGPQKSDAIASSIEGPMAAICPASVLQTHRFTTFVIDDAAASKLKLIEYYKWVFTQKRKLHEKARRV